MRLWSLHPMYLDTKGLVALWREGLLAKAVLEGKTRGYTRHPQLQRFRRAQDPVLAIAAYLRGVLEDAQTRGYRFDETKLPPAAAVASIPVTAGQIAYERQHLLDKLASRDTDRFAHLRAVDRPQPHPLFIVIAGPVEPWEVVK